MAARFILSVTVGAVAFGGCVALAAEVCAPAAEVVEISAGVYVRPGRHAVVFEQDEVANIGFVVGERCVAVIDTGGSYEEGRALDCAIRNVTESPVCYVINTHVHPDHMLGNLVFDENGADVVGHVRLPRAMALLGGIYLERAEARAGRTLGPEHIVPPGITVEDDLELDLGGRSLHLVAHPSAHTDNDLTVYDEKSGTLWLGDLVFIGHAPVIDASITGWIGVLEGLEARTAERVVPGHGPPQAGWPDAARDTQRYLSVLRDEIREFIAGGGDLRAAQDGVGYSEADRWLLFESYHKRNVGAAFTELEWED